MNITAVCRRCKAATEVPESKAGTSILCPACGELFFAPSSETLGRPARRSRKDVVIVVFVFLGCSTLAVVILGILIAALWTLANQIEA